MTRVILYGLNLLCHGHQVVVGDHDVGKVDPGEDHLPVCDLKIHPQYRPGFVTHDVGLVKVSHCQGPSPRPLRPLHLIGLNLIYEYFKSCSKESNRVFVKRIYVDRLNNANYMRSSRLAFPYYAMGRCALDLTRMCLCPGLQGN